MYSTNFEPDYKTEISGWACLRFIYRVKSSKSVHIICFDKKIKK